jgi:hypothetical protein
MSTKNNPGEFDCYARALPDEPLFVLLARDPQFYDLVTRWSQRRWQMINCGDRPETDGPLVLEAAFTASEGAKWRRDNNGLWRK